MANLPQELIDLVVGHVQSLHDARTLAAASLVSRSWRAASIGHLFLRIRFGLSITNRSNGIEAFTLFLSDPTHARIASCVKVLVIQTISAFESTAYLDLDALCALIPKLPKLSLVNITDIQIKVAATSVPRTSIPVRELQLGSVEVEHGFVGLAEVLTALRATHRLFIKHTPYGVDPPSSLPPPPARAAPFLALRTLAICKASDPLLQFFERAIASCARVQLMPYGGTFSFAALGAFVRALAPTLECLCVHGRLDSDKRQSDYDTLHLDACTSIRTVVFTPDVGDSTPWDAVLDPLRRLPRSTRRIGIAFKHSGSLAVIERDMEQLKRVLWRFEGLEEVLITFEDEDPWMSKASGEARAKVRECIRGALKDLDRRGVLRVSEDWMEVLQLAYRD